MLGQIHQSQQDHFEMDEGNHIGFWSKLMIACLPASMQFSIGLRYKNPEIVRTALLRGADMTIYINCNNYRKIYYEVGEDVVYELMKGGAASKIHGNCFYQHLMITLNAITTDQIKFNRLLSFFNPAEVMLQLNLCYDRKLETAKFIINSDFNIDEHDLGTESTILHKASEPSLTELFLELGANPDAKNVGGSTPLHWRFRDSYSLYWLLLHGADCNATNIDGRTPLHFAAAENNLHAVWQLLNAGADPTIKDISKCTAVDLATDQQVKEHLKRRPSVKL